MGYVQVGMVYAGRQSMGVGDMYRYRYDLSTSVQ